MFRSKHPRELLNEIKWRDLDLSRCDIYYIHRGAPKDTKVLHGDKIGEIGKSFLTFNNIPPDSEGRAPSVMIPYHRIFRITYEGQTIYER
ncbi:MAG: RNA repair domain-containing protein [Methanocellales archaeon]|nr:RNA repair domain-containing protein [Methanocellales archaeon]MDD3291005.1 RNA repair domain-containing protein [Methanocellales archaeon]MDD5234890.1 RNA repair domain-containing protein [Methanocellales archaeon]MDD5484740.1 RNA repair domain-containing protein [Methanocellales archaeon]